MDREGKDRTEQRRGETGSRSIQSGTARSRAPQNGSAQSRTPQSRETQGRSVRNRDAQGRSIQSRDAQGRSVQSADTQAGTAQGRNTRRGAAQSRELQGRNAQEGTSHKDGHGTGSRAREYVGADGIKRTEPAGKSRTSGSAKRPSGARKQGKKKGKKKRAAFDAVSTVVLIVAVCVFIFSLYKLVMSLVPYYTGTQEYDEIKEIAITADSDGEGFSVNFNALMEQNSDTVGWIRFDKPDVISYPVVQGEDNDKYLEKTFTDNDNLLGAIFVDYRNSGDFSDRNTFIYGHNLQRSGQMFSELKQYKDEEFGKENPYFYIYTPSGEVRTYTIFSAGIVDARSDSYNIKYADDAEFQEYLDQCLEDSLYDFGVEVNADSKIVSLSTCTSVTEDERFLVHGVLTSVE